MSLLSELRRRNVHRMAALYLAAAWLVMQIIDVVEGKLPLPELTGTAVLSVLAVGFPIALIISWFYEVTPEGISRDTEEQPAESTIGFAGRRVDFVIIAVLAAALLVMAYDKWWLPEPPDQSIAVLPFENMSGDPEQEYFSDGLSDTLIHVLAQVSGLKVTAKTSSFFFKGKNIDVGEIARELNVGTILEGSVQRSGNRVRVIAQLINAEEGTHLWSKTFDRELEDIFVVQDEIAQKVVEALKVTLLDSEEERLAQRYQPTLEAYEQLILGWQGMANRTVEGLAAAEQHFKQAIAMDPDYALAYVGLAETYALQVSYVGLAKKESLQRRQPLVKKALELDPLSGEAYVAKAWLHWNMKEKEAAEEAILQAIELSPNYAMAHYSYGTMLSFMGRSEEALAQMRMAAELDPMAPMIQHWLALTTWNVGRAEEALTLLRRNIERNPELPNNYWYMADLQTVLGNLGIARRWYEEARKRNSKAEQIWRDQCIGFLNLGDILAAEDCANQYGEVNPDLVGVRVRVHIYKGEWEAAILILESKLKTYPNGRLTTWWLADLIAGQGDVERARRMMADRFPEYLEGGLEVTLRNLDDALVFAAIHHANGETQQRDVQLLAMEKQIATMHRIRGGYGAIDVYIHAMRGDRDRAIAGLREAIDMGWRATMPPFLHNWWTLRQDWKLGSLRQDPEFIALMNELEADLHAQRQWYEENKDKPLF